MTDPMFDLFVDQLDPDDFAACDVVYAGIDLVAQLLLLRMM
ncbi:hypothetical protein [Pseudomonas sp. ZS1P83]